MSIPCDVFYNTCTYKLNIDGKDYKWQKFVAFIELLSVMEKIYRAISRYI